MRFSLLVVTGVLAAGCTREATSAAAPAPAPKVAAPAALAGGITGTVAERFDASSYTYLRLTTASGEVWAAIPTAQVAVGQQVTLANPQRMENFTSKTLNRTFPVIQFCTGLAGGEVAAAAPAPAAYAGLPTFPKRMDAPVAAAAPPAATPVVDVKVEKASGADGRTVAEIFAQRAALKDKPVQVRGKVVKVTLGVMGKNWLHVRDGSGTEGTGDSDLTITTLDPATLGETVVAAGPVHLERDFGAGYAYPVIIEDARLSRP